MIIAEKPVSLLARQFAHHSDPFEYLDSGGNRGERKFRALGKFLERRNRVLLQSLVDAQRRPCRTTCLLYLYLVFLKQRKQPLCGRDGSLRGLRHAVEKEREPRFPGTVFPYIIEEVVLALSVLFEVEA